MTINRRVAVPALAALAVSALGVSVALLGGDPDRAPRTLPLASARAEADNALGAPTSAGSSPDSGYTLVGTLPSGRPDDARAWALPKGPADATRVQALARALEAGQPAHDGSGWRAGGLFVSDESGQSWWYSVCPDGTVSSDGRVACAVDTPTTGTGGGSAGSPGVSTGSTGSGVVTPEPPPSPGDDPSPTPVREAPTSAPEPTGTPVPESTVTSAARPVLVALGLSPSDAQVETSPYGGSVTVPGQVDGIEVYGFSTRVDVSADGEVTGAAGWLAAPERGDAYPLITAQEGFDNLPPRMVALLCPIGPDGKGCLPPPPAEVTGARLGLSVQPLRDGTNALVPSWLFTLKGSTEVVPVVAVQDTYLGVGEEPQPTEKPGASTEPVPGIEPGTGSGSGGNPGQVDPGAAREPFSFDAAFRGEKTTTVVVRYGDSSSCPHENVTHQVKESSDQVVVFLEADARSGDMACTDDYRAVEVVVELSAALGDRTVVDGTSGRPVPLTTR